ncbi:MAG: hypothetical protein S4CHLAM20_10660 [Chlamydiia bacterium]|nr:hypothetical protein [Chlamydiia bacterium]
MQILVYSFVILPFVLFGEAFLLPLEEKGSIRYNIENNLIQSVERLSKEGEVLYSHNYFYNKNGKLLKERMIGGLGEIIYYEDNSVESPYHIEKIDQDDVGHIVSHTIDDRTKTYKYTQEGHLITPARSCYYKYDCVGDLIQKDDIFFEYDDFHRLIGAFSRDFRVGYEYDKNGRRVAKIKEDEIETYMYLGDNIIGVCGENNQIKTLRIPGLFINKNTFRSVAIEVGDVIYAPIYDFVGNIAKLIDIETYEEIEFNDIDPFGRGIHKDVIIPWIFSGKHYDKETGLIYFGERYYCPELMKWASPDPLMQTSDPYEYCLNNPLSYFDPDGKFGWSLIFYSSAAGWAAPLSIIAGGILLTKYGYDKYQAYSNEKRYREMLQKRDQELYEMYQRDKEEFRQKLQEVRRYKEELKRVETITQAEPLDDIKIDEFDPHIINTKIKMPELPKWNTEIILLHDLLKNTTFKKEDDIFKAWMERGIKKGLIDHTLPADIQELENSKLWKETTDSRAKHENCNRRSFVNLKTGEMLEYDRGIPGKTGHKAHDHMHRRNPFSINKNDYYLDVNRNPIHKHDPASHLYSPKLAWWLK